MGDIFNFSESDHKVVDYVKNVVSSWGQMVEKFKSERRELTNISDQTDLSCQFLAFCEDQVPIMQKTAYAQLKYVYKGDENEYKNNSHQINCLDRLTNMVRGLTNQIKEDVKRAYKDCDDDFRKCPYCGEVYVKVEGCAGSTFCGNRPVKSEWDGGRRRYANYKFSWRLDKATFEHISFNIRRTNFSQLRTQGLSKFWSTKGFGCGRKITWRNMSPVQVPSEMMEEAENKDDLYALPGGKLAQLDPINHYLRRKQDEIQKRSEAHAKGQDEEKEPLV